MKIDTDYLHSYGSPMDIEILTLPVIKAIFSSSNIGLKYVKKSVMERRIQILKFLEKILYWLG